MNQLGKIPPQDIQIEEAVLCGLLISVNFHDEMIPEILPEYFYKDNHQEIYSSISELYNKNQSIDLLTVTDLLRKKEKLEGVGGAYALMELTEKVNSPIHLKKHVLILKEKWLRRELIRISGQSIERSYKESNDVFSDLDGVMTELMSISESLIGTEEPDIKDATFEVYRDIEKARKENKVLGLQSGFIDFDRALGGFVDSDLIVMAARPGMGKTALAVTIAKYISLKDPVGIFSLEMSKRQLLSRLIFAEAKVNYEKYRRPKELSTEEMQRLESSASLIRELKLLVHDKGGITFPELRARAIMLKKRYGIKALVIDYLQLMQLSQGMTTNDAVGVITKGLKALAKELNIPIIILSQLSRKCEERTDKRPMLSDLRDSGNIEQDADAVIFIYRGDYYGIQDENEPQQGISEIIFSKNRHGPPGMVKLEWNGDHVTFYDYKKLEF